MSSCENRNYELALNDDSRRRELSLFEEEDFSAESYVLSRLRIVEEEEEMPWKSAVYRNFCACVRKRQIYHCATNTKKELRDMITELKNLQRRSAREMIKSMISHYALFIQTSQEVTDLEEAILKLRTLLRSLAAIVRTLATTEWTVPVADPTTSEIVADCYTGNDLVVPMLEEDAYTLPDDFDIFFAERKVDLALSVLEQGEDMVDKGYACTNLEADLSPVTPVSAAFLQSALLERRARIVNYLSDVCQQPSVGGVELRSAIAALNRLGEGTRAHTLLLLAHHGRLAHGTHGLRPSGTSFGGAFTATLSQMTFSAIAQAIRDSLTVFGAIPAYASELVVWARDITEQYAGQIKQHVLSSAAAAGGLQAAAECVQIAFGHCSLLEAQGLTMCPSLIKVFRSSVEQAMEANLKRIEESVAALASAEDWMLMLNPQSSLFNVRQSSGRENVKLTCSAHRFNVMAQDFLAGVSPLVSMQLAGVALKGLALRFNNYVDMLIKAVPDTTNVWKENMARSETQQLALLSNATALAHELLPSSAFKLLPVLKEPCDEIRGGIFIKIGDENSTSIPGFKDWQRKLRRGVKRLQDHICGSYVKTLFYSAETNEPQLTPANYLFLDKEERNSSSLLQENMPSVVFQSLFFRLRSISKVAKEMAFSNEGVVTPLLARFLEVFVSYLDEDHFWSIIEDGPSRIGPIGLKQLQRTDERLPHLIRVESLKIELNILSGRPRTNPQLQQTICAHFVLDMQFVIQMASSSGCVSRSLQYLVPDLTSRAVHAFAATGADPESVLPSDEWILEAARVAIDKLSEDWNQRSIDQDPVAAFAVFREPIAVDES